MDVVWIVAIIAGCVAMWWAATKIDPHWTSRDGTRFVALAQPLSGPHNSIAGRAREVRCRFDTANDEITLSPRRLWRSQSSRYRIDSAGTSPRPNKRQFVLTPLDDDHPMWLLRLPATSRTTQRIEAILAARERPGDGDPLSARGTDAARRPPGRDR